MTRKELSQLYYLNKLKKEAEQELDRLYQERGVKALVYDDMPHAQGCTNSPTENVAIQITEQIEAIKGIVVNCQKKEKEIWQFIEEVEKSDSYLAAIIKFRCINQMRWNKIAVKLNTTSESCRKYYARKIPEK